MKKSQLISIAVLLIGFVSIAAWWDFFQQPKEEESKQAESESSTVSEEGVKEIVYIEETESSGHSVSRIQQPVLKTSQKVQTAINVPSRPVAVTPLPTRAAQIPKVYSVPKTLSEVPQKVETPDLVRIQEELREIVARTEMLQKQVQGNRVKISEIMERSKIHEKILREIKTPRVVQTPKPVEVEYLLNVEKMRLIAEQSQRSREELRLIEQSQTLSSAGTEPRKSGSS